MTQKRRMAAASDFRRSGWLLLLGVALAPACGSSVRTIEDTPLPPSFFGGAAAVVQPTLAGMSSILAAGNGEGGGSALPNPCANVPEGKRALIDDFEDSNQEAVPEVDREAYWFPIKDDELSTGTL